MSHQLERPEVCTDEMLMYLDALRESGITNMWGAPQYLVEEFDISRKDASAVFTYWIHACEEIYSQVANQ